MWNTLRNYSARTKVLDTKTTIVRRSIVPKRSAERALCPELLMLWFCSFHRTRSCLHVDFECYKLALWQTLRQSKFMNFWSFLTRSGNKHDEDIRNCSSTPQAGPSSQFCCESNDSVLTFPTAPLQDSESHSFLGNIILKWNVSLLNKNRNVYCCWIVILLM